MVWLAVLFFLFILQVLILMLKEYKSPPKLVAWLLILFLIPYAGFIIYWITAQKYGQNQKDEGKQYIGTPYEGDQKYGRNQKDEGKQYIGNPHEGDQEYGRNLKDEGKQYIGNLHEGDQKYGRNLKDEGKQYIGNPHEGDQEYGRNLKDGVKRENNPSPYRNLFEFASRLPAYPPSYSLRTTFYTDGGSFYDELMADLEKSEHHIHMEFYIFRDDGAGQEVADILKRKAKQGVEVRCMIDGLGSIGYPQEKIRDLEHNGVKVHLFMPPSMSVIRRRLNYRNHRKIVVCDGKVGYVGGMNIGLEYMGHRDGFYKWRDTQLRVTGECVYGLQHTFLKDWEMVSGEKIAGKHQYFSMFEDDAPGCTGDANKEKDIVQMIPGGPDKDNDVMLLLFYGLVSAAQRSVYITTPYFIPDESIRTALKYAALNGLDVRILIPGKPDSRIAKLATVSHLEELMKVGVRVYEYQKGFIHAKSVVIDSALATVGTANLDMRSIFSNFELNTLIYSSSLVGQLEEHFWQDIKNSREILYEEFCDRKVWQKILEGGARMLSPLF